MYHKFAPKRGFRRNNFRASNSGSVHAQVINAINAVKAPHQEKSGPSEEYLPVNKFEDFPITPLLLRNIIAKNYTSPTPIQDQAIGPIMEGRDFIGIANTGTGKTAAFLIPLIDKVYKNKSENVLIVTPTRELAVQIYDEFRDFSKGLGIFAALLIGGGGMGQQKRELRNGCNFVIGTPGRIKDHIQERNLNLSYFTNVVLDEADRMVDIGFIHDIKQFISLLAADRQSLFFSATISGKVKEVLGDFVHNPVTVSVKKTDTVENIHQDIIEVEHTQQKIEMLHDLLIKKEFEKVLIFGRTKWGVQKLADELIKRGFKAGAIHGNKRQNQRLKILQQFKRSEIQVLLATDVASRGLDIPNVSHVINYEMPESYDDYIHRIGRTGRANKKGIALTFAR